jgi:hypothetical protein
MPAPSGDRFSAQSFSDCAFCPPGRRGFRTARTCNECGKPLCLVCRPAIPNHPFLCPECSGGAVEDTLHNPGATADRLASAGITTPTWLIVLREQAAARAASGTVAAAVEELIVPE